VHGEPAGGPTTVLETVYFDMVLLEGVFTHLVLVLVGKEVHNLGTMITLELDHLAHVFILNDGAIAR
jgi:hypothetical protein